MQKNKYRNKYKTHSQFCTSKYMSGLGLRVLEGSGLVLYFFYNKNKLLKKENTLVGLSTERTTFSQTGTTTSGLAQNGTARSTKDNGLSVTENSANV